jgi:hypothetical protein
MFNRRMALPPAALEGTVSTRRHVPGVHRSAGIDRPDRLVLGRSVPVSTHGVRDHDDHVGGAVLRWCVATGNRAAGPRWEVYGHWYPEPAVPETEVFYLLA